MCSTNLFIFLATNEHKFSLTEGRARQPKVAQDNRRSRKSTAGRASQLLYYCQKLKRFVFRSTQSQLEGQQSKEPHKYILNVVHRVHTLP